MIDGSTETRIPVSFMAKTRRSLIRLPVSAAYAGLMAYNWLVTFYNNDGNTCYKMITDRPFCATIAEKSGEIIHICLIYIKHFT